VEPVTFVFAVLTAVVVFVTAAVTVGREARRLDAVAPRVVYRIDEAVVFVGDRLPVDTQARVTFDEVEAMLREHLNWLGERGLQAPDTVDRRQDIVDEVVVDMDALTAHLLARASERGVDILDDVDVVRVVEAHLAYLGAIGAVGPPAD
jgi:hypothetical protein